MDKYTYTGDQALHEAVTNACVTDKTPRPVVTSFVVVAEVLDDHNNRYLTKIPLTDGGCHPLPEWSCRGMLDHVLMELNEEM